VGLRHEGHCLRLMSRQPSQGRQLLRVASIGLDPAKFGPLATAHEVDDAIKMPKDRHLRTALLLRADLSPSLREAPTTDCGLPLWDVAAVAMPRKPTFVANLPDDSCLYYWAVRLWPRSDHRRQSANSRQSGRAYRKRPQARPGRTGLLSVSAISSLDEQRFTLTATAECAAHRFQLSRKPP